MRHGDKWFRTHDGYGFSFGSSRFYNKCSLLALHGNFIKNDMERGIEFEIGWPGRLSPYILTSIDLSNVRLTGITITKTRLLIMAGLVSLDISWKWGEKYKDAYDD